MNKHRAAKSDRPARIICATVLLLAGWLGRIAWADSQCDVPVVGPGIACSATYYALARMTNNAGHFWITPPPGTHTGILTDASGWAPPYSSLVSVTRKSDNTTWCSSDTNTLTFTASASTSYSLTAYIISKPPPPSATQYLTLQITWQ